MIIKANEKYVPPYGTRAAKVGGNYAGSMLSHKLANEEGYSDCIYLDPAIHTKIEEARPVITKLYKKSQH